MNNAGFAIPEKPIFDVTEKEWAYFGINVNAVASGYINTDMIKPMFKIKKNA